MDITVHLLHLALVLSLLLLYQGCGYLFGIIVLAMYIHIAPWFLLLFEGGVDSAYVNLHMVPTQAVQNFQVPTAQKL